MKTHEIAFKLADLLVINLDDGHKVSPLLAQLNGLQTNPKLIVLMHHIHAWTMIPVWNSIPHPKIDLTCIGHWRGSGVVEWGGKPKS